MSNSLIDREITQGVIPIGTPKAYKYDAALVEAAKASVQQGMNQLHTDGNSIISQANTILAAIRNQGGYPLKAATASAMTDTTKIYVYTGSETGYTFGDWYYHNGTAWTDGGVYNAMAFNTDHTLTVEGAAADAKVVGYVNNEFFVDISNSLCTTEYYSGGTMVPNNRLKITIPWLSKGSRIILSSDNYDILMYIKNESGTNIYTGEGWEYGPAVLLTPVDGFVDIRLKKHQDESAFDPSQTTTYLNAITIKDMTVKDEIYVPFSLVLSTNLFKSGSLQSSFVTAEANYARSYLKFISVSPQERFKITVPKISGVYYKYRIFFYDNEGVYHDNMITGSLANEFLVPAGCYKMAFAFYAYNASDNTTHDISRDFENDFVDVEFLNRTTRNYLGKDDKISSVVDGKYALSQKVFLTKDDLTSGSLQGTYELKVFPYNSAYAYLHRFSALKGTKIRFSVPEISGVYYKYRICEYGAGTADPTVVNQTDNVYVTKNVRFAFGFYAFNSSDDSAHDITSNYEDDIITVEIFDECKPLIEGLEDRIHGISNAVTKIAIKKAQGTEASHITQKMQELTSATKPKNLSIDAYLSETKPLVLLHFSDIHGDATRLQRIDSVFKALVDKCDDVICTGDLVANRFINDVTYLTGDVNASKYLLTIGNHDALADTSGWDWEQLATQSEQYTKYFGNNIANWGVTYTSGLTYYYKDYAVKKIRLIVVNNMLTGDDKTAQLTWLATMLENARQNNLNVIVAMHYPPRYFTNIDCTFTRIDKAINSTADGTVEDTVQHFINAGGSFVCYLTGHAHSDYVGYPSDYSDELAICIDAASLLQCNNYSDVMRVAGTLSEDLFNLVVIDTSTQTVKIIRVGCDRDSYQRHKGTLTINYSTKEVVYND